MTQYVIGINGGGSHSRLVAIDENMKVLGRAEGGPTNIAAKSYEDVLANIQSLLDEFCSKTGANLQECIYICMGSAGASTGANGKLLEQIFRTIGYGGELKVMNDAELVLLAETKGASGAIIISGTGSVGYAVNGQGTVFRVGGWGHIIDDGGSGYRIGMDAIHSALMDFDGRGERTLLRKMITDFFGYDTTDGLTGYVYGKEFDKAKIAEVAMLVEEAATQDDNVAIQILQQASKSLVSLAHTLIKQAVLDERKIILSGSVLLNSKHIRSFFENEICKAFPKMQIVEITKVAEMGAAHLAWQHCKFNSKGNNM